MNIPSDRANANEIFVSVKKACKEASQKLALAVVEGYQEKVVETLCSSSGRVKKKGLGKHRRKGDDGQWCRHRRFKRAGYWQDKRRLRGDECVVEFHPAMVECLGCGNQTVSMLIQHILTHSDL